jgi:hypothetical protein
MFELDADIADLGLMCRVVDRLKEEAAVEVGKPVRLSSDAWELLDFASCECTLRARHLSARFEAAAIGITTSYYGNVPDVPAAPEGGDE